MARGNRNGTVLDLIVIFVRRRAPFNIQIKFADVVKLLNCVSLKSSKNGLSHSQWVNLICLCLRYDTSLVER